MKVNSVATETAAAKINLSLKIIGRRADGYHLLSSMVAFADFGDRIFLCNGASLDSGIELEVCGPESKGLEGFPLAENLVVRAAKLLTEGGGKNQLAAPRAVGLKLEKTSPSHRVLAEVRRMRQPLFDC